MSNSISARHSRHIVTIVSFWLNTYILEFPSCFSFFLKNLQCLSIFEIKAEIILYNSPSKSRKIFNFINNLRITRTKARGRIIE